MKNYSVCAYDRPGYGKSEQASAPQPSKVSMDAMKQALSNVKFPIDSATRRVVCIGHSAGGQLCRYYAERVPAIKGIFLLDSVFVNRWAVLIAQNMSTDPQVAFDLQVSTTSISKDIAYFWPLFLGSMVFKGITKLDFNPPEFEGWKDWQLI